MIKTLPVQGTWVQLLVGTVRSCMLRGPKRKSGKEITRGCDSSKQRTKYIERWESGTKRSRKGWRNSPKIMVKETKITSVITARPNWSRSEGSRDRYFQKVKLNVHLMHLELSGAD